MNLNFEKWHGNGNDFVIVDSIKKKIRMDANKIVKISDRNKGIGFDQLIQVCLPTRANQNFFIKFYNADGSEAGMCLNGIRCASQYIWNNKFAPKGVINIQTKSKNIICLPKKKNKVQVFIDSPKIITKKILNEKLKKNIKENFLLLNIGNNHLCIKLKSIKKINLIAMYDNLKSIIEDYDINLSIFSKNSEFIQIRTYENGVGETLSCGSASLCVASHYLTKKNKIIIKSIGGELDFQKENHSILITGPTNFIYRGNLNE